jgi:uncharacterized Tic20 family protein
MIEQQIANSVSNSKVATTIAKQLWPSMLFLVIMSLITLCGSKWLLTGIEEPLIIIIAFWIWFVAMLIITGFGVYVFILDARIQFAKAKKN